MVRHPEVRDSVAFVSEHFASLTPGGQRERSRALTNKLFFLVDPATKAQFCASTPGLDWTALMRERQLWLSICAMSMTGRYAASSCSCSGRPSPTLPAAGAPPTPAIAPSPLAVTIDEVSFMFSRSAGARSPLVDDLDSIINQYSRNVNLELTIAWQELYQLPPGLKETLLSLGTQFFGRMTHPDSMREIADRLTVHDPRLGSWILANGRDHELGFAELRETNRRRLAELPNTPIWSRARRARASRPYHWRPSPSRHWPHATIPIRRSWRRSGPS